jgi:hypothetical protein
MKKIIVSAAVAALALTTTASALEDIKVNGQAKIWYETDNGTNTDGSDGELFNKKDASAEVTYKLGMTGKQGNVGFGATVYQASTMGLEGVLVNTTRTSTTNGDMYVGEAYITAPVAGATLKLGKQELDTPLLYTERWHTAPNTFNGAVGIIPASDNLTVVAAYVGQVSTGSGGVPGLITSNFKTLGTPATQINDEGAFALAALFKADALAVNAWYYSLPSTAMGLWVDASLKAGPADVKAYVAHMIPDDSISDDATTAFALSAGANMGGVSLFAAGSMVTEDGPLHVGNYGTGGKKTMLPTAAVYLDGLAVAQPGATAVKVKAATKAAGVGVTAQLVSCMNDNGVFSAADESAMELDLIASAKLGDFNIKGIVMHRDFENKDAQQHVRLITSINF